MAVIIDMDVPKDCYECILRCQDFCFDGHHESYLDKSHCPLKSVDEIVEPIIEEIKAIQKEDIECDGSSDMGMVLDIIHKHLDKENR